MILVFCLFVPPKRSLKNRKYLSTLLPVNTTKKLKISIEIFWSKCDRIWSHLLKKLLIFCIVKFLVTLRLNNLNAGYNHIRSSGDRKQLKKTSPSLKSFSEIFTDVSFPTSGIFFENMKCWFNEWLHIINHRSSLIDHER